MGSSSQVKINYEPALPTWWLVEAVHRIYGPSDPSLHVLAIINDFMEFHQATCVKMATPLNSSNVDGGSAWLQKRGGHLGETNAVVGTSMDEVNSE
ncbi:hypothetical protein E5D57_009467 [Metarhizium anisopliae]|nr:hypothetical protein E5D57_009467 [Metarhizium anisopliae]